MHVSFELSLKFEFLNHCFEKKFCNSLSYHFSSFSCATAFIATTSHPFLYYIILSCVDVLLHKKWGSLHNCGVGFGILELVMAIKTHPTYWLTLPSFDGDFESELCLLQKGWNMVKRSIRTPQRAKICLTDIVRARFGPVYHEGLMVIQVVFYKVFI